MRRANKYLADHNRDNMVGRLNPIGKALGIEIYWFKISPRERFIWMGKCPDYGILVWANLRDIIDPNAE